MIHHEDIDTSTYPSHVIYENKRRMDELLKHLEIEISKLKTDMDSSGIFLFISS